MDPKMLGLMGGVGAVGAGGAYLAMTNPFKEEKSAADLLQKEAFVKPLNKDDAKWNDAWKRYRDAHKVTSTGGANNYKEIDIWGLSNWAQQKTQENAFDEFKNKCEEKSKLKMDPISKDYQDFKNYCARPKTISELIGEDDGVTLLSKSGAGDGEHWNSAWKKYRASNLKSGSSSEYNKTDIWTVTGWSSDKSNGTATENYKTKCESQAALDIDVSKGLKDTNFVNVRNWCTKAS
ncbi:hypothetical protein HF1_11140 [Mycoplasma haemofelis str. Langford 1]|uniref:Uncharacterized protein n=1 Tax=Mycoplasma haemofelis (strain Langford 1) TaxID=941640 RepID=E8ZJ01_MYCHL|nr:hypothetical protein [Mycoplasma haemofelis]CBY93122.1 hypothetical protein HF1_11140 [Mycoplasma haemofelis str. Langford 1]